MAPLPDGSLPRMDALLHKTPTTNPKSCADVQGVSPLGSVQQWCGVDRSMMQWLSQPSVISALHVETPKGTETNNLKYTGGYRGGDLRSLYKELALKYKLWIYNGQEDGCIPYTGAEVSTLLHRTTVQYTSYAHREASICRMHSEHSTARCLHFADWRR
jgi:hypothetical protein